jgi:hypothetical protein
MSRPALGSALTLLLVSAVLCACSGSDTRSESRRRSSAPSTTSPSSVAPTTRPTTAPAPTTAPVTGGPTDEGAGGPPQWLITGKALAMIATQPGVQSVLDSSKTLVITGPESVIPEGWTASRVISFTSYQKLHQMLTSGLVPPGVRSVIYDNERWSFTPLEEQQDPGRYTALAAIDAHAHGMTLIATPATTLTGVVAPGTGPVYQRFIDAGIIADVARSADSVLIQAQGSITAPSFYASFVHDAAAQAREANPHVVVLAGLSTNPAGAVVTPDNLLEAVQQTRGVVDGYWLNIPIPGPYCMRCNPSRPDLAVGLLRDLISGR